MASLKTLVVVFALCLVPALVFGQGYQNGPYNPAGENYQGHLKLHRRAIEDIKTEEANLDGITNGNNIDNDIKQSLEGANVDPAEQVKVTPTPEEPDQEEKQLSSDQELIESEKTQTQRTEDNNESENQIDQNDVSQENLEVENGDDDTPSSEASTSSKPINWTSCDYSVMPRKTCYDCNHLFICKPIGGLIKPCNNPFKPYCRNGNSFAFCSSVPSSECS